jgi:Bacterial Ig-like domain
VVGGVDASGAIIGEVERFDPRTHTVTTVPYAALTPRAHHTATLLSDGRLLLAGGDTPGDGGVAAELWDTERNLVDGVSVPPRADRRDGAARLLPDGRVYLSGGLDQRRSRVETAEVFDPEVAGFAPTDATPASEEQPRVAAVLPADQTAEVLTNARISVRFSEPVDVRSVAIDVSVGVGSAPVPVAGLVVAAEGGMLAFFTPAATLAPGIIHHVHVRGARTATGRAVPASSSTFTTAREPRERDDRFDPMAEREARRGIDSPWRQLPPLQAPRGVTALAGQVLLLNGTPLADVTLAIGDRDVRTDRTGRFLLRLGSAPSGVAGVADRRHDCQPWAPYVWRVRGRGADRRPEDGPSAVHDLDAHARHGARGADRVTDRHGNRDHDAAYPRTRAAPAAADRHHRSRWKGSSRD